MLQMLQLQKHDRRQSIASSREGIFTPSYKLTFCFGSRTAANASEQLFSCKSKRGVRALLLFAEEIFTPHKVNSLRIRTCAHFWWGFWILRMRRFSSQFWTMDLKSPVASYLLFSCNINIILANSSDSCGWWLAQQDLLAGCPMWYAFRACGVGCSLFILLFLDKLDFEAHLREISSQNLSHQQAPSQHWQAQLT